LLKRLAGRCRGGGKVWRDRGLGRWGVQIVLFTLEFDIAVNLPSSDGLTRAAFSLIRTQPASTITTPQLRAAGESVLAECFHTTLPLEFSPSQLERAASFFAYALLGGDRAPPKAIVEEKSLMTAAQVACTCFFGGELCHAACSIFLFGRPCAQTSATGWWSCIRCTRACARAAGPPPPPRLPSRRPSPLALRPRLPPPLPLLWRAAAFLPRAR
jgi:hypothetical protein